MLVEVGCGISGAVVKKDGKPHFRVKTAFPLCLKLEPRNIVSHYSRYK